MIGSAYWYTGITLTPGEEGHWKVRMDFFDFGFCQLEATEGILKVRYLVKGDELDAAVDVLLADAQRLGLRGRDPTIYVEGDGEWPSIDYPPDWRRVARQQARRLGWRVIYDVIH